MKISSNGVIDAFYGNKLNAIPLPFERLSDKYDGVTDGLRAIVIKAGNLKMNATGKEILEFLDTINETQQLLAEQKRLKYEIAKLSIDKAIKYGLLESTQRDAYIKLATASLEATMNVIQSRKQDEIELEGLLKLSGHQLYMNGKLERLKELSEYHFKLKFSELQNGYSGDISETKSLESDQEKPESELNSLLQLTAKQLYMDGKLERLKELDINQFKLKYKEFFKVEYPF